MPRTNIFISQANSRLISIWYTSELKKLGGFGRRGKAFDHLWTLILNLIESNPKKKKTKNSSKQEIRFEL